MQIYYSDRRVNMEWITLRPKCHALRQWIFFKPWNYSVKATVCIYVSQPNNQMEENKQKRSHRGKTKMASLFIFMSPQSHSHTEIMQRALKCCSYSFTQPKIQWTQSHLQQCSVRKIIFGNQVISDGENTTWSVFQHLVEPVIFAELN